MGCRDDSRNGLGTWSERFLAKPRRIVVIGSGVAAVRSAFELRNLGFDGEVTVVGSEDVLPYDRTLLSTVHLTERRAARILRSRADFEDSNIRLRLGIQAKNVAPGYVHLSNNEELPYDRLIICTGGRPIVPRSLACEGIHTLRTLSDMYRLREELDTCRRLIVIGGGFVGSEIASSARSLGIDVTIVEQEKAPLGRQLGSDVGERLAALHHSAGTRVFAGLAARAIRRDRYAYQVHLENHQALEADVVVVGVGMAPVVEWLAGSLVGRDRGIVTDSYCRTSMPGVLAAGDCARSFHVAYRAGCRFEHWDTAAKHGVAAAQTALGEGHAFMPVPMFWSDQNGVKLQCVGATAGWDEVRIVGRDSDVFSAHYYKAGRPIATFAANDPIAIAKTRSHLRNQFAGLAANEG